MKITSDPKQMTRALHFLCYLNAATHTSGRLTAKFHAELERALQAGMHILLVHETRAEANGATFKKIIESTPEKLKWDSERAQKRLYKELAVMICGSVCKEGTDHLNVGLHLLSNAITVLPKNEMTHVETDIELLEADLPLSTTSNEAEEISSFQTPAIPLQDEAGHSSQLPPGAIQRRMSQLPRGSKLAMQVDGHNHPFASSQRKISPQLSLSEQIIESRSEFSRRPSQLPPVAPHLSQLPFEIPEESLGTGSVLHQVQSDESESVNKRSSTPGKLTRQRTGRRMSLKLDHRRASSQECLKEGPGRKRCCLPSFLFPPSSSTAQKSSISESCSLATTLRRSSCREEALQRKMSVSRPQRILRTCVRVPGIKLCTDAGFQAGRVIQTGAGTVRDSVNATPGVQTLKSVVERVCVASGFARSEEEVSGAATAQSKVSTGWRSARLRDAIRG